MRKFLILGAVASLATPALAATQTVVLSVRRADFLTIKNPFSPDLPRPGFMPGVSTYRAVQIRGATSLSTGAVRQTEIAVDQDSYIRIGVYS